MPKMLVNTTTDKLVIFYNHNRANLPVDENVLQALSGLSYVENNAADVKLKLVIYHGDCPGDVENCKVDNLLIKLEMSSQGLPHNPKIKREEENCELKFFIQGGSNSNCLPSDAGQWERLIRWLLNIKAEDLVESDTVPLPDDPEVRKFIYTEPYPDALVAWYLAEVAKEQNSDITLSCDLRIEAQEDYNKLKKRHRTDNAFDRHEVKALLLKIANI